MSSNAGGDPRRAGAPGMVFIALGVVFIALGSSGRTAFLGVGAAFIAIGVVYLVRGRREGGPNAR